MVLAMLATTWIACGSGGAMPTQAEAPRAPVDDASGSFTLRGAGYGETRLTYSSASGGLVFCRRQSPTNALWVRLAANSAADGANAPHLDIDFCNFTGAATYRTVHDVNAGLRCTQGATWDLWWHDGPSKVFVSPPSSSACEAVLTLSSSTLQATFQCQELAATNGTSDRLDVLDGSFRCTVTGP